MSPKQYINRYCELIRLTFIFLLVAAVIIPSILNRGNLLNPLFLNGFVLFGGLGFFALEIIGALSFLGEGVKYGVAGFILLLLAGAITGGNAVGAFLSGTISGVTLFYLKSLYAVYVIVKTETRARIFRPCTRSNQGTPLTSSSRSLSRRHT